MYKLVVLVVAQRCGAYVRRCCVGGWRFGRLRGNAGLCCRGAARRVVRAVSCAGFPVHHPTNAVFGTQFWEATAQPDARTTSKFCRETPPWPGRRYRGARPEVRTARSYSDASGMVESPDSASGALGTVPVAVPGIRPTGANNGAGSPRAQPAVLPVQGQRRHRASHGVGWHP